MAVCLVFPTQGTAKSIASADNITFSIPDSISAEDENYVREGIRLAEDYLEANLKETVSSTIVVNVRATEFSLNPGVIGMSEQSSMIVFTGSDGWLAAPPFSRVHAAMHEFIHVYQHDRLQSKEERVPAWFIEGSAEYLSYDALIEKGLVTRSAADAYRYFDLGIDSSLGELESYEGLGAFQESTGPTYDLAYLAVEQLALSSGPKAIGEFIDGVSIGLPMKDAFAQAFGTSIDDFYAEFEAAREDFIIPTSMPKAFDEPKPKEQGALVRIVSAPDSVSRDSQLIVIGKSTPNTRCIFYLEGDSVDFAHETTVDGAGRLFWLLTITGGTHRDEATLTIDCGRKLAEATILIAE
jgi:hypothetical protein